MTKLEMAIRQVSDLRDFYMKIKKEKSNNLKTGTAKRRKATLIHRDADFKHMATMVGLKE